MNYNQYDNITNLSSPNNSTNLSPRSTSHRSIPLQIGSLNCRHLLKTSAPSVTSSFIHYLRHQSFDILTLQDTNSSSLESQQQLDLQFQTNSSIWSKYCGIVSLNPALILSDQFVTTDGRFICCQVSHQSNFFEPFLLITLYAPPSASERREFFHRTLQLPLFSHIESFYNPFESDPQFTAPSGDFSQIIITGDFNYHPHSSRQLSRHSDTSSPTTAQSRWHQFVNTYLTECVHPSLDQTLPTFRRDNVSTTIDYIFLSQSLASHRTRSSVAFINSLWTDHALLSVSFKFGSSQHGKGFWRANPFLATNRFFIKRLKSTLDQFCSSVLDIHLPIEGPAPTSATSPQDLWDQVKQETKRIARSVGRRQASWRQNTLDSLQSQRNHLLTNPSSPDSLHPQLSSIEAKISHIQQDIADSKALKARKHWQEHGELSAGYLKRIIDRQFSSRYIEQLQHPDDPSRICKTPAELQDATVEFYRSLFTPSPIDQDSVDSLLETIPISDSITTNDADLLLEPFTLDDLLNATNRTPRRSSPGMDGLPYEILKLLFSHNGISRLVVQVFNDALLTGVFPPSWQTSCVSLLPKKGDLTTLRNWRPIALINTDAKVFTRLLNSRLMNTLETKICQHQLGFMPGRFIGENGRILQLAMTAASISRSSAVGMLLDQEKAYDRVHPDYLSQVLSRFGVPPQLNNSIMNLFFSTQVSINVNGFLTKPFQAQRGLRQGDPLSPLLFNLAFDPFLRLIDQDASFQGFNFAPPQFVEPPPPHPPYSNIPSASTPPAVKALAYADDVLVILSSFQDFDRLQAAISTYAAASNAHLNYNKTQAFSLSGATLPEWQQFLTDHHISTWHDAQSLSPLRYLGYPVYSSPQQRNVFMEQLITSISNACNIHSQRQLSIRGRATVLNSLILSRLWHVLRLVPLAKSQLSRIRSISSRFMNGGSFPRISYATLILPRTAGGVKLLDPESQYKALQWRWLLHLLQPLGIECTVTDFPLPSIPYCKYLLQLQSAAPDDLPSSYIWPLLFPSFRSSYLSTKSLHSFSTLFKSIDSITSSTLDDIVLSPTTYLCLPLSIIISPSCTSSPLPHIFSSRTFKKMIGSHILRLDPVNHHLRFRHFTSTEIFHYSRTSKQRFRSFQSLSNHLPDLRLPFAFCHTIQTVSTLT
ncbi:hypothetical protein G6F38_007956 [Rhizopus arrhizus]|nr:hypothetical protein G6F38_007956 [Rhizopus arrhizus]